MSKGIYLVFQDCFTCEDRKGWFDSQSKIAAANQIEIDTLPFYQRSAKKLIWGAHEAGISLPFFTDGKKFSQNLEDFVKKPQKSRRNKKVKEKDVNSSED